MMSESKYHHAPVSSTEGKKLRVLMVSDYGYLAGGAELMMHDLTGTRVAEPGTPADAHLD